MKKIINCRYCQGLGQNYGYYQEQKAQSFACLKCGGTGIEGKGGKRAESVIIDEIEDTKDTKIERYRFRYTNLDVG